MLRSDVQTPPADGLRTAARAAATTAAAAAGVRIEPVHERADLDVVRGLVDTIWRPDPGDPPITSGVLRALTHGGNPCTVAYDGDRPVGVCIAFSGVVPARSLYSHIAGVLPDLAGRRVGRALKLDQRAWALANGRDVVLWTFDPLVRRNAFFNLVKLGARPSAYLPDFYGPMRDAINAGQPTDRCEITWRLDDAGVVAAAAGRYAEPELDALLAGGAAIALADEDGRPVPRPAGDAAVVLVQVPPDIEGLRASGAPVAAEWREAARAALGRRLGAGWTVTGFTRDGHYVLERP